MRWGLGKVSKAKAMQLCREVINPPKWKQMLEDALQTARRAADRMDGQLLGVDLGAFGSVRRLHDSPPIYTIDDFLSEVECAQMVRAAPPLLHPSRTSDKVTEIRTSSTGFLPRDAPLSVAVFERAARLLPSTSGTRTVYRGFAAFEDLQVARYAPGQKYEGHFDGADPHDADAEDFFKGGGQRVATVLIYLNSLDQDDGGATSFSSLDLKVQPKRGRAVVFFPGRLDGTLDKRLYHEAQPARATKWVSQLWVRQIGDPIRSVPHEWLVSLDDDE